LSERANPFLNLLVITPAKSLAGVMTFLIVDLRDQKLFINAGRVCAEQVNHISPLPMRTPSGAMLRRARSGRNGWGGRIMVYLNSSKNSDVCILSPFHFKTTTHLAVGVKVVDHFFFLR
jgi:hypothetical protein